MRTLLHLMLWLGAALVASVYVLYPVIIWLSLRPGGISLWRSRKRPGTYGAVALKRTTSWPP